MTTLAPQPIRIDRRCGKGWEGEIGQCKRAKVKSAAVHGGEMVAAWAVGKVAGGAIAQLAVAHGVPHEVAKIVSESSIQALTATAIHAATHKSSPRKLAGFFVTQAAAAAAGKAAHGEAAAITTGSSPAVQQASTLAAGKLSGLGTVQAIEKHGRVLQGLVSRMKRRTDAAKGERLSEQELRTLMELGLMGVAMLEKRTDGKKKKPCDDQCQCDPCKRKHDALIDAVLALHQDKAPGKPCGRSYISARRKCSPEKSKQTAAAIRARGGIDKLKQRQREENELKRQVKATKGQKAKVVKRTSQGKKKSLSSAAIGNELQKLRAEKSKSGVAIVRKKELATALGLDESQLNKAIENDRNFTVKGKNNDIIEWVGKPQPKRMKRGGAAKRLTEADTDLRAALRKGRAGSSIANSESTSNRNEAELIRGLTEANESIQSALKGEPIPGQSKPKLEPIRGGGKSLRLAKGKSNNKPGLKVIEGGQNKSLEQLFKEADKVGAKSADVPQDMASRRKTKKKANDLIDQTTGKLLEKVNQSLETTTNASDLRKPTGANLKTSERDLAEAGQLAKKLVRRGKVVPIGAGEKDQPIRTKNKPSGKSSSSANKVTPIRSGRKNLTQEFDNKIAAVRAIEDPDERAKAARELAFEAEKLESRWGRDQGLSSIREKTAKLQRETKNRTKTPQPKRANKPQQGAYAPKPKPTLFKAPNGQYYSIDSYTKPELRERLKAEIKSGSKGGRPGQWSARKSQLLAQRYKAEGGGYRGPKTEAQKSQTNWNNEDWDYVNPKDSDKPRVKRGRYLPKSARESLSPGEKAATNRAKREANRSGEQFSAQPKKIAKKTAQHRDGNQNGWLIYPKGRRTAIATPGSMTRSEAISYANKKKKRGGKGITSARRATDAEQKLLDRGVWVRTGPNGEPAGKSNLRGFGPKPKRLDAIVVNPTLDAVVTKMSGGSISVFFTEPPSLMIAQDLNDLDRQFSGLDEVNYDVAQKRMWFLSPPPTYCVDRTSEAIALSLEEAGLRVGRKYRPLSEYERKSKPVSVKSFSAVKAVKDMQKVS